MESNYDIGIIGGGVIGLSVAYQAMQDARLRGCQPSIVVIDQPQSGQASWAGSGILPPPPQQISSDPLEQLQRLSLERMPQWSQDLKQLTGIDNQYESCGGYYVALTPGEHAALIGLKSFWEEVGIEFELLEHVQFEAKEPWLAGQIPATNCRLLASVPGETQLRNPRHLKALRAACQKMGITFLDQSVGEPLGWEPFEVRLSGTKVRLDQVVVAAGSWTSRWLKQVLPDQATHVSVFPMKGQILLYKAPERLFSSIVNFGTRYFVPRQDGHLLVGSTEEEVGFAAEPTMQVRLELQEFVRRTLPQVEELPLVKQWSGFRPASFDLTPIIGPLPSLPHVLIATGHFRSGIQWSIGTALCVSAMLHGEQPPMDIRVFARGR